MLAALSSKGRVRWLRCGLGSPKGGADLVRTANSIGKIVIHEQLFELPQWIVYLKGGPVKAGERVCPVVARKQPMRL
jgi:hypothetical protein